MSEEREELIERMDSSRFRSFVQHGDDARWGVDAAGTEWRWYRALGWDHAFVGPVREFVVERATWYRRRTDVGSKLLREEDGHRCCLGFLGRACGISDDLMRNALSPASVAMRGAPDEWPAGLIEYNDGPRDYGKLRNWPVCTEQTTTLMGMNDGPQPELSDEEHEALVADTLSFFGLRPLFV